MKLYQVKDWNEHYENNKSRERKKCSYVCIPNRQDGLGFNRIMAQKDGAMIYGIWCLLLGALSRQESRDGWLTDSGHQTGTPLAPTDLALLWRRLTVEIERALTFLSSPSVGWLLIIEATDNELDTIDARQVPAKCPSGALEEKRIEEKGNKLTKARAETEKEVIEFCQSIGLPESDGTALWLKWEANGWTNGGEKIKDWKGTIRAWRAAGYLPSQKQNNHGINNGQNRNGRIDPGQAERDKNRAACEREGIKPRILNPSDS